jgi:hypothetical protein
VPRLQLGRIQPEGAAEAAEEAPPAAVPALPPPRPAVPPLALGKLGEGAPRTTVVQAARIPAANFSTLDASAYRAGAGAGPDGEGL